MPELFGSKGGLCQVHAMHGDAISCLIAQFTLDKRNDAFVLCGHQSLLATFTSVSSFDPLLSFCEVG